MARVTMHETVELTIVLREGETTEGLAALYSAHLFDTCDDNGIILKIYAKTSEHGEETE